MQLISQFNIFLNNNQILGNNLNSSMISEQEIIKYLQMSLQANNIKQSQQLIQKSRLIQGFTTKLLLITDNNSYPIELRQTALVNLKTTIDQTYQPKRVQDPQLSQNDKSSLRGSILKALIRSCQQTRLVPLFCQIIYLIGYYDFPQRWSDILQQIIQNLKNSSDFNVIYGSLLGLKSIVSIYSSELEEKRANLYPIIHSVFGILQMLASKLLQNYNQKTGAILLVILKIFYSATYIQLPHSLKSSQTLHTWLIFIKQIVDYKIDQKTPDVFVKTKKKAIKIVYRFIQHHANPSYDKNFADFFLNKYSIRFLQSFVLMILTPINNPILKHEILNISLAPLPYLYKNNQNCRLLLENYKQKIIAIILTGSFLNIKDIQTWNNDPVEFINKQKQSRKFIIEVIKMYPGCGSIVTKWLLKTMQNKQSSDIQKQIYMSMFAQLSNQITDEIDASNLVNILCTYIIPMMKHESDLLKARSCQIFTSYADIILPNEILTVLTQNLYNCFMSNILPIKSHAAIAFSQMLQHYNNIVPIIQPYITNILSHYIKLIEIIDTQDTVLSFKGIISVLGDKIQPYATHLIRSISDIFFKYCQKQGIIVTINDEQQPEQQYQQNAGDGCLAAIRQILNANLPQQCYKSLSDEIYKLVSFIFSEKSYNFLQQGLNILNLFLFKIAIIPNNFNELFPLLCYMITNVPVEIYNIGNINGLYKKMIHNIADGTDKDILENIIGSMRNYISKLKIDIFTLKDIAGVSFIERILQSVDFIKNSNNEGNLVLASTLFITLIQNNIGNIDNMISNILSFAITQIKNHSNHKNILLICIQIILMCFFYNATLTVSLLYSQNLLLSIIDLIISNTKLFKNDFQKQRLILAIVKILQLGPSELNKVGINHDYISTFLNFLVMLAQSVIQDRQKNSDVQSQCSQAQQQNQNSHAFSIPNNQKKSLEEEQEKQDDWDQQYNKLYASPLQAFDEVIYIGEFLKGSGICYLQYLNNVQQESLTKSFQKALVLRKLQ